MSQEPNRLTAVDAAAMIARGEITSEELVGACLDRIITREDIVGAWISIDPDAALASARAADRERSRGGEIGPLHGVPFGVKDIIDTRDLTTEYGSKIYAGHQPDADSPCVEAMFAAGAVLLGKTVTTEFATFTPGKTRNPHNSAHTPGGSSSGTAAAVADFMVPAGLGTQTSGSVIRPASFCGVCAIKPSHGVVPLSRMLVLVPVFDCIGTMARSFDDLALIHDIQTGNSPTPLADGPGRTPAIGLCRSHQWDKGEPAARQTLETAAVRLTELGADIRDVVLPHHFADLPAVHGTIMNVWLSRNLANEYERFRDKLSERLRARIELGIETSADDFDRALKMAERCRSEIDDVLDDRDVLMTPSAPGVAPADLAFTGDPAFNMVWTLLQVPCVNVPHFSGPGGLPVGIQLIGRLGDDRRALEVAKWIHARL
jgi:Asp-tRNA(Asn)/Glu-tRNA(Gln) amidotransferase A subunit family amidase